MLCLSVLFDIKPVSWGLRGDPFLWEDIRKSFRSDFLPYNRDDFIKKFELLFTELTGAKLEQNDCVAVEKYKYGGMSSGGIGLVFWKTKALPLLISRLDEFNNLSNSLKVLKSNEIVDRFRVITSLLPHRSIMRNNSNYEFMSYVNQLFAFYLIDNFEVSIVFASRVIRAIKNIDEVTEYHILSIKLIREILTRIIYSGKIECNSLVEAGNIIKDINDYKFL